MCCYEPVNDIIESNKLYPAEFRWQSTGDDPYFIIKNNGCYKEGWLQISVYARYSVLNPRPKLYINYGHGISEATAINLPAPSQGSVEALIKLTASPTYIRFDPMEEIGYFDIEGIAIKPITRIGACVRMLRHVSKTSSHHDHSLPKLVRKNAARIRKKGFAGMMTNLAKDYTKFVSPEPSNDITYRQWVKLYDTINQLRRSAIVEQIGQFQDQPKISVLMPAYNTPEHYLRAAIESVCNQLYRNWELCIANDGSTEPLVKRVLDRYAAEDERIKVIHREENGHISLASNSALELATGEYIVLLDHDDKLAEHALYRIVEEINAYPEAQLIYSDEDKLDEHGKRFSPHFKSDWNPELFYSINYLCHLTVYRTDLVRAIGGFRAGFEGSQDYDLALRYSMQIHDVHIRHIPEILYHWRATENSTAKDPLQKDYATRAGLRALRDHFKNLEPDAIVETGPKPTTYRVRFPISLEKPKVSLIIPTRNGCKLVEQCVESIRSKTHYHNYEIIIVDNQSDEAQTLSYLDSLQERGLARILHYDAPFNFSAINNFAVRKACGEIVGLINNDVEVLSPDWLEEMVSFAVRPEVGAVGAKLLYPDGRIQHAGVILGVGGVAGHSHKFYDSNDPGYYGRLVLPQSLSAVTGACLVLRRKCFEDVGGFDEKSLPIAFNDVDLCLRIREAGYRIVWSPHAQLYHHESVSRGLEDTSEKQARFEKEANYMKQRWGEKLRNDPYYNLNLTLDREDFSLAFAPRVASTRITSN
jgi:glycosyltransferase involved in cell wall biosynthesis